MIAVLWSLAVFLLFLIHGSFLGMTDDEAYYWVLAQKPALGYAYHPPGVAWLIRISQVLLDPIVGPHASVSARFPAALCAALIFWFSLAWIFDGKKTGIKNSLFVGLLVFSFPGVFASAWMIVPDLPYFVGWGLLFLGTWRWFRGHDSLSLVMIALGCVVGFVSKYTMLLGVVSAALWGIWRWRAERPAGIWKFFAALFLGSVVGNLPTLFWNLENHWASILYQVSDRHSGQINWLRYARFWLIQVVAVGPAFLILFGVNAWRGFRLKDSFAYYALFWAAPAAAIFLIQPLFSDFKPHWVIAAWFPLVLYSARYAFENGFRKLEKTQMAYGLSLVSLFLLTCHTPIISQAYSWWTGKDANPLWDVSNDMAGWPELVNRMKEKLGDEVFELPVFGSRYQTASQMAFQWPKPEQVARVPRSEKEFDEWPEINAVDSPGPDWPKLLKPALYVADGRYTEGPGFKEANCEMILDETFYRGKYRSKLIKVWKCVPQGLSAAQSG